MSAHPILILQCGMYPPNHISKTPNQKKKKTPPTFNSKWIVKNRLGTYVCADNRWQSADVSGRWVRLHIPAEPPSTHTCTHTHQSHLSLCSRPLSSLPQCCSVQLISFICWALYMSCDSRWYIQYINLLFQTHCIFFCGCVHVCVCVLHRPICFPSIGPINEQHLQWVHELPGNSASVSTRASEQASGYGKAVTMARFKCACELLKS